LAGACWSGALITSGPSRWRHAKNVRPIRAQESALAARRTQGDPPPFSVSLTRPFPFLFLLGGSRQRVASWKLDPPLDTHTTQPSTDIALRQRHIGNVATTAEQHSVAGRRVQRGPGVAVIQVLHAKRYQLRLDRPRLATPVTKDPSTLGLWSSVWPDEGRSTRFWGTYSM
jgi:hypothetical protein